jgi:hypothetical protein
MQRHVVLCVLIGVVAVTVIGIYRFGSWNDDEAPIRKIRPNQNSNGGISDSSDFELPKDKQKQIWDAEHVAFEIEKRFGVRCLAALQKKRRRDFVELCRPGFSGSFPNLQQGAQRSQSDLTEVRAIAQTRGDSKDAAQVAEVFVSQLMAFEEVTAAKLRTLDVRRTGADDWTTRLLITFAGKNSQGSGVELTSIQTAEFSFSKDADLGTKPVVNSWHIQSLTRRTAPRRFFFEATKDVGLDQAAIVDNWLLDKEQVRQYRFQFAVADFNRDGWLDIAVAERNRSSLLQFFPKSGKFRDVAGEVGIHINHALLGKPTKLAAWFDFDNDGFPDLLLGNQLYHNEQGRTFRNVTWQSGLQFKPQAMGAHVVDFDCDGRLDLYLLYQASEESPPPKSKPRYVDEDYGERNRLWRNLGNGRFRDVTYESRTGGGYRHSLAATWFFYDDDRFPDLYIANDLAKNVLLRNNGNGSFSDISERSRAADFATTMGVAAGDTNNDGTSDLYVANMFSKMGRRIIHHVSIEDYPTGIFEQIEGSCAGSRLYLKNSGKRDYREVGEKYGVQGVGWAYAPAMADFDNDGWLDLYATTGFLSFRRDKPDG